MRKTAFIAAVVLQLVIVALVPLKKVKASWTGREIRLATAQYDPYDFMRGYYVDLNFEVGRPAGLTNEPTWARGQEIFTVIAEDTRGICRPISQHQNRGAIPSGALFMTGRSDGWRVTYGIERFYMPEARRGEVNEAIAAARGDTEALIGIIRLDNEGNSVLTALEIEGRRFEF